MHIDRSIARRLSARQESKLELRAAQLATERYQQDPYVTPEQEVAESALLLARKMREIRFRGVGQRALVRVKFKKPTRLKLYEDRDRTRYPDGTMSSGQYTRHGVLETPFIVDPATDRLISPDGIIEFGWCARLKSYDLPTAIVGPASITFAHFAKFRNDNLYIRRLGRDIDDENNTTYEEYAQIRQDRPNISFADRSPVTPDRLEKLHSVLKLIHGSLN